MYIRAGFVFFCFGLFGVKLRLDGTSLLNNTITQIKERKKESKQNTIILKKRNKKK
jgi:hypothetical protein